MKKLEVLLADDEPTIMEGLLKLFDWEIMASRWLALQMMESLL